MEDLLLKSLEDGVLLLTMNRPDSLNALSADLREAMLDALAQAADDPGVGAVVLTGAGRAFSAGGDIKRMGGDPPPEVPPFEVRVRGLRRHAEIVRLLHEMPKPTIAMLRGAAAGAGMSLALSCDMRIASDNAKMTTAFVKVGLSGDFGGHYFLTRLVGAAKARELYFTSPMLDAAAALGLGLVNRVVADADLEVETMALARSLAQGPRITLGYMKQNLNLADHTSLQDVLDAECIRHVRCTETQDHPEAIRAFVEKRAARFSGR